MGYTFLRVCLLVMALALANGAAAEGDNVAESDKSAAPDRGPGILALLPAPSVSQHSVAVASGTLAYESEAGTVSLLGGGGEVTAKVFYVAYDAKAAGTSSVR